MSDAEIRERQRRAAVTGDVEDHARVYADKLRTAGPCVGAHSTQNMTRNEALRRWERDFMPGEKHPQKPGMARIETVYENETRLTWFYLYQVRHPPFRLRKVGVVARRVVLNDSDRVVCFHCRGVGNPVLADLVTLAKCGDEAALSVVGPQPGPPGDPLFVVYNEAWARRRLGVSSPGSP